MSATAKTQRGNRLVYARMPVEYYEALADVADAAHDTINHYLVDLIRANVAEHGRDLERVPRPTEAQAKGFRNNRRPVGEGQIRKSHAYRIDKLEKQIEALARMASLDQPKRTNGHSLNLQLDPDQLARAAECRARHAAAMGGYRYEEPVQ